MPIEIIHPADERAWHDARRQDITASVAAGLLGIHPYSSPYQLWAEKTGRMTRSREETKAMRRGTLLEPVAVQVLADEFPTWEIRYKNDRAYYRDTDDRIGATPDVFARRPDREGLGIVQIKTVSHEAFMKDWVDEDTRDVIPPLWIAVQTLIEAKLTGASWAAVGAFIWNRDALELQVIDIPIKAKLYERVRREVADFWAMVAAGEEPDPNWKMDGEAVLSVFGETTSSRLDLSGMPGIESVLERYDAARAQRAAAEKVINELKPQIIYTLGNYEGAETEGWRISAPTVRKRETIVKESQFRALRISRRKDRR